MHPVTPVDGSVPPRPVRPELRRGRVTSGRTSTARSRGSGSTRPPPTPALTSGACRRCRGQTGVGDVRNEPPPGGNGPSSRHRCPSRGNDLRCLVLRAERPLRRGRWVSPARAWTPASSMPGRRCSGGQGVYRYGTSSGFPAGSPQLRDYWVDVVYSTGAPTVPTPGPSRRPRGTPSAVVSWTAPADGGAGITGYTVTPYIGSTAQTGQDGHRDPAGDQQTVTGLTNGTAYTFRVTATDAVGTDRRRRLSHAVTPRGATAPAAPRACPRPPVTATAVVSWTAPADGGSGITGYTVTPFVGSTAQAGQDRHRHPDGDQHHGHRPDQRHRLHLHRSPRPTPSAPAPASAASATVTPSGPTAPAAPTGVSAAAGDGPRWCPGPPRLIGGSGSPATPVTPYVGSTPQPSGRSPAPRRPPAPRSAA